jgi:hypothetical protein
MIIHESPLSIKIRATIYDHSIGLQIKVLDPKCMCPYQLDIKLELIHPFIIIQRSSKTFLFIGVSEWNNNMHS